MSKKSDIPVGYYDVETVGSDMVLYTDGKSRAHQLEYL